MFSFEHSVPFRLGEMRSLLRLLLRVDLERQRLLELLREAGRVGGEGGVGLGERDEQRLVVVVEPAALELRRRLPRAAADDGGLVVAVLALDDLRDAALAAVVPRLALAAAHPRAVALPHRLRRVDGERALARLHDLRLLHLLERLEGDRRRARDARRVDAGD